MNEKIKICKGKKCQENGSARTAEEISKEFGEGALEWVECMGYCERGPNLSCEGRIYHTSRAHDIVALINNNEGEVIKNSKFDDLDLDELL